MFDVDIALDLLGRQPLQLGVKLGHPVLGQQEEQVQPQQLVLVGRLRQLLPWWGVKKKEKEKKTTKRWVLAARK